MNMSGYGQELRTDYRRADGDQWPIERGTRGQAHILPAGLGQVVHRLGGSGRGCHDGQKVDAGRLNLNAADQNVITAMRSAATRARHARRSRQTHSACGPRAGSGWKERLHPACQSDLGRSKTRKSSATLRVLRPRPMRSRIMAWPHGRNRQTDASPAHRACGRRAGGRHPGRWVMSCHQRTMQENPGLARGGVQAIDADGQDLSEKKL